MRDQDLTIVSAARALRAGRLRASALVEASLDAVAKHNPTTNAFTTVHTENARRAAAVADGELGRGLDRGPLHGIPISLKDLIDERGSMTTAASRALDPVAAARDATLVTRLRQAGAVLIGRTNLHEFALGTTSEDSAFGAVHHPRDAGRSAGGSSGGSAVAVALGMGLGSIGTDTGGSVRIPAAACGVVGLKPTYGEVPLDGVVPLSWSLDHVGPIAKTVEDAALLFAVIAGHSPGPLETIDPSRLKLTVLRGLFTESLQPEVRQAFGSAVARLMAGESGALPADGSGTFARSGPNIGVVRDPLPPEAGFLTAQGFPTIAMTYADIVLPEAALWHAPLLDVRADHYTAPVHERILAGREVSAVRYLQALRECRTFRAGVDALLANSDALLLPTLPIVAPPLGAADVALGDGAGSLPVRAAMLRNTQLFNLTGHPAISIPLPSAGLPIGLQLVGRRGETMRLAAVAAACAALLQ